MSKKIIFIKIIFIILLFMFFLGCFKNEKKYLRKHVDELKKDWGKETYLIEDLSTLKIVEILNNPKIFGGGTVITYKFKQGEFYFPNEFEDIYRTKTKYILIYRTDIMSIYYFCIDDKGIVIYTFFDTT